MVSRGREAKRIRKIIWRIHGPLLAVKTPSLKLWLLDVSPDIYCMSCSFLEHLRIHCCWRSDNNRVSRPLLWQCIRVSLFIYVKPVLKFWHPEEQTQQRAISYWIRGAFRVRSDSKLLLESTIWRTVRPSLQQ